MAATKTPTRQRPKSFNARTEVLSDGEVIVVETPKRRKPIPKIPPRTDLEDVSCISLNMELFRKICARVGRGEALYKICQERGMPSRQHVFAKVASETEYNKLWVAAREARAEYFADEMTELADAALNDSSENIQARKLQVNTRQWLASRFLPKVFGDKVTHSGDADNPIVTQLVLGANDLMAKIKGPKEE